MTLFETLKRYIKDHKGVAAVWFGMMVPLVVTSVGLSVDMGQTYLVKERLSRALDAAALAAAAMPTDDVNAIEEKINDFLDVNYPDNVVGFQTHIEVSNNTDTLYVEAWAELNPTFMQVFGQDTIQVKAVSEVTKEVKAIEVVLVMDVTGSMSTNNNIATLRTAATNFVNTMFERVNDTNMIKIGLVPFSSSVNVGNYGLGKNPSGTAYDTAFVNNPNNTTYSTTSTSRWGGCVIESTTTWDDRDDHDGPWDMYRYCRNSTPSSTSSSRIRDCDRVSSSDRYTSRDQNYLCPKTPVTPLTNSKTDLLANISLLRAEGNTYINNGLTWGLRLISPEFPFREGVSWSNEDWTKAIILMTDGESTMHQHYSIYGPTASHDIDANDLDNRIEDVCEDLRDKNVLVYTITFDDGVSEDTKEIFENCATNPSMWYDAPTQARLLEVYQSIAKELANLHLSK